MFQLDNFSSENEGIRIASIKLMSYMVNDIDIHEAVNKTTNFSFLLTDLTDIINFDSLFPNEQ